MLCFQTLAIKTWAFIDGEITDGWSMFLLLKFWRVCSVLIKKILSLVQMYHFVWLWMCSFCWHSRDIILYWNSIWRTFWIPRVLGENFGIFIMNLYGFRGLRSICCNVFSKACMKRNYLHICCWVLIMLWIFSVIQTSALTWTSMTHNL